MKKYLLAAGICLMLFGSLVSAQTAHKARKGTLVNVLAKRETRLWEAWKNHQAAPFRNALSWDTVMVGESGVAGKEDSIKGITSPDCTVQDYSLSDYKVTMFSRDVALLTYKAEQHVTCAGTAQPTNTVASTLWIQRRGKWYAAFHQETPGRG